MRSKATLAKGRDGMSAEIKKSHSERDSAAGSHHGLLASIRRFVKAVEERKDKSADTLVKPCTIYDESNKVTVEVHVEE